MDKIASLGKKAGNGQMMTPVDTLQDAIDAYKEGAVKGRKVVILALDDTSENFNVKFFQAWFRFRRYKLELERKGKRPDKGLLKIKTVCKERRPGRI